MHIYIYTYICHSYNKGNDLWFYLPGLQLRSVLISEDKVTYKQEKMHSRNDKLTK